MLLYCTTDAIGTEHQTGAGHVTFNELEALKSLDDTEIINPPIRANPFETDELALKEYKNKNKKYKLAHFYAGTFSELIIALKNDHTKISFTAAAHDINVSKEEHEKLGIPFNYPHLIEPSLWKRYLQGYLDADVVICPSFYSKKIMEGYGCKHVEVIPHGCHLPSEVKPQPDTFTVGYLGSIGADKGLIYLLQAWKKLNYKDALLVIAGRDSVSDYFINFVREHGGGSIHLAGWMKSPGDLYNQCSLYLQPSSSEGYGCEVLEAMSYGRPIVCSDCAGACCVITNTHGLIVPSRNPDAIADAINHYKTNPEKLIEHGKMGIRKSKDFTWDKIRKQYCEVWNGLIWR